MKYAIVLPMPPSINAAHSVGRKFSKGRTAARYGSDRTISRSEEYTNWLQWAAIAFRDHCLKSKVTFLRGRIKVQYIFIFKTQAGDTDNRIKVCQDFLQHKFFENDSQIDDITALKRISKDQGGQVIIIMEEMPDQRYDDPMELFNQLYQGD